MTRAAPLLAPLLAATLALSPVTAAPVQAGEHEAAKIILGLAALTALGVAIADGNKAAAAPAPAPISAAPIRRATPLPAVPHVTRRLPAECKLRLSVSGKPRTVYGKSCLLKTVRHESALPRACARQLSIFGKVRNVYFQNCLKENGWRT